LVIREPSASGKVGKTAHDYMMWGVVRATGEEVGLKLVPNYFSESLVLWSKDFGSPQVRGRVYTLLIREDMCSFATFTALCHLITTQFPECHTRATTQELADFVQKVGVPDLMPPGRPRFREAKLAPLPNGSELFGTVRN
jgi:site-specific DNA-cytosine methylase